MLPEFDRNENRLSMFFKEEDITRENFWRVMDFKFGYN